MSNGRPQKGSLEETSSAPADGVDPNADPAEQRGSLWNLPNQLTIARLILSVIFFVLLAIDPEEDSTRCIILNVSFVLFILAVVTDFLDGYFARKLGLTSTFGRIADPFADKIVVCGGFVMLTAVTPLVKPWFAVVIIFREFLVSGLRSFLESRGVAFGAALSGKLKMIIQSVTIPVVLFYEANLIPAVGGAPSSISSTFRYLTIVLLALTLLSTVASCLNYLQRAYRLIRAEKRSAS